MYLAHNAVECVEGLPVGSPLSTLDLSYNQVSSLRGIEAHPTLEELWASKSLIDSFDALLPLTHLPRLACLYLEHSPIAADFEYRLRITSMLSNLEQLDATDISRR